MSTQHLLMIEDDARLAAMVGEYLTQSGFVVTHMPDGESGLGALQDKPVDLVVLDLMLPGIDGLEVCRRIRALPGDAARVPVLMLTAKGDPMDRVVGLEIGADDYLPKPFEPRELLARIRAVLRRAPPLQPGPSALRRRFGGLVHDPASRRIIRPSGAEIALTSGESRMLGLLLDHPGQVLTRMRLLDLHAGREARAYDRAVDNTISRLRHKIEADPRNPRLIVTEWGGGYRLAAAVEVLP